MPKSTDDELRERLARLEKLVQEQQTKLDAMNESLRVAYEAAEEARRVALGLAPPDSK